jgi:hypothetical protein
MIAITARDTYGAQQFSQPATLLIGQRRRFGQDAYYVFFEAKSLQVLACSDEFGVVSLTTTRKRGDTCALVKLV